MMSDRREWTPLRIGIFVAIIIACALTRFLDLGAKPIMHDESLFAYYTEFHLHRAWGYQYQPILHGPAHLWLQALIFHIFGVSDYTLRLGSAILGFAGVFWIWSVRGWLGRAGVFIAMAFYTFSPCMMLYQRFFREDALFIFTTLWIVASGLHFWRTRSPGWCVSFILANCVLFFNKESCLFLYFAMATYFLLWILHDWGKSVLEENSLSKVVFSSTDMREPIVIIPMMSVCMFGAVTIFLTRVLEGIHYDADVVQAIGRDFALRDVRSLKLAAGVMPANRELGWIGNPWFWRAFYVLLAGASTAIAAILYFAVRWRWGAQSRLAELWAAIHRSRYYILGALALGFCIYMILFTTAFKFPKGPLQLYHETLAYWMGQNAQHRIKGPFHMHLLNMLVYELPEVLIVLAGWFYLSVRVAWTRVQGVALLLVALAFAGLHILFFRGIATYGMLYFAMLGVWSALLGFLFISFPKLGRVGFPLALLLFFVYSAFYFSGPAWNAFASTVVQKGEFVVASSGRLYMDDRLSLTSGFHLFLIAFLIIMATMLAWDALNRHRAFVGFLIWWLVIMAGACSYAREKVPWVGIHIAVPLILLASVFCQSLLDKLVVKKHWRVWQKFMLAMLGIALAWNAKAAINLCFSHPGDVRERLTYAETPIELKNHAKMIQAYAGMASVRDQLASLPPEPGGREVTGPEWEINYNRMARLREVRVLVANDEAVWPMRWYLRDVEWTEGLSVSEAVDADYPFMFLSESDIEENPDLQEKYYLYHGRARMHWIPQPIDARALAGIWRATIPLHNQSRDGLVSDTAASKRAWRQIWDYMIHRRIPEEPYMGLSTVRYVFAARKDLAPGIM